MMGMSNYYKKIRESMGNELILMPCVAGIIRNLDVEILLQNKGNGEKWSATTLLSSPKRLANRRVFFKYLTDYTLTRKREMWILKEFILIESMNSVVRK
jgi:hypothetical protein